METPKTRTRNRPRHVPTPKMSDRKKSLFSKYESKNTPDIINEDSDLGPMSPLEFSSSDDSNDGCKNSTRMSMKCRTSFKNILQDTKLNICIKPTAISKENMTKVHEKSSENDDTLIEETEIIKSNYLKTPSEQITKIIEQPKISFRKSLVPDNDCTPCNGQISPTTSQTHAKWPQKRHLALTEESDTNPKVKIPKLDSKARTSLSFDEFISTSSFYGNKENDNDSYISNRKWVSPPSVETQISSHSTRRRSSSIRKPRSKGGINNGVSHKIRKRRFKKENPSEAFEQERRLKALSLKILKKSILSKNQTDEEQMITKLSLKQIQRANNILRKIKYPNTWSETIETTNNAIEPTIDDQFMEIQDENKNDQDQHVNKKFFKTGESRSNIYKLKDNVMATMKHGKICMIKQSEAGSKRDFDEDDMELIEEHKEVDDIIKNLSKVVSDYENDCDDHDISFNSTEDYIEKFRVRIPYKTSDPNEIQRQHNLLDFLIFNNILTEENFKIFIMEPDNFAEEASRIVNQFIVMTDMIEDEEVIPVASNEIIPPISPTSQISNMTSELILDCPETDVVIAAPETLKTKEIYPIFEKGFNPKIQTETPKQKSRKIWRPIGSQYQIDAGQKSFGAKSCPECGLLYSANEPEEELLHLNFHNSFHILKFKGWKDEKIVSEILEWGLNGRIIVVDATDTKRKWDRVRELLKIIDAELGFPSIEISTNSFVYLAIAQNTVIGVCVGQHRTTAHRMIPTADASDLCTEEIFPVKCGISKIWVTAPYRRQNVAKYLINCLRSNFLFGICLEFDDIAFSSPTADGKALAMKLCKRPDFLVYF